MGGFHVKRTHRVVHVGIAVTCVDKMEAMAFARELRNRARKVNACKTYGELYTELQRLTNDAEPTDPSRPVDWASPPVAPAPESEREYGDSSEP